MPESDPINITLYDSSLDLNQVAGESPDAILEWAFYEAQYGSHSAPCDQTEATKMKFIQENILYGLESTNSNSDENILKVQTALKAKGYGPINFKNSWLGGYEEIQRKCEEKLNEEAKTIIATAWVEDANTTLDTIPTWIDKDDALAYLQSLKNDPAQPPYREIDRVMIQDIKSRRQS